MTTTEQVCLVATALITGYMIWRYERLRKLLFRLDNAVVINLKVIDSNFSLQSKQLNNLHASLSKHIKSKVHKRNQKLLVK